MSESRTACVALMAALTGLPAAAEPSAGPPADAAWSFNVTAYPTFPRGADRFTTLVATADRGPLHLEARHNYEAVGATSAFVGWSFAGGDDIEWEVRPLLGGAWGELRATVPGVEASVTAQRLDAYVEAEYVADRRDHDASYFYAWSELGYRPVDWLRVGVAGQRTRVYGNDRDIQRGPFVQVTWSKVTVGGYWFNPGAGAQVFVGMLAIAF